MFGFLLYSKKNKICLMCYVSSNNSSNFHVQFSPSYQIPLKKVLRSTHSQESIRADRILARILFHVYFLSVSAEDIKWKYLENNNP